MRNVKTLVVIYACAFTYGLYNLFIRFVNQDGSCKFKNDDLASAMGSLNAACFIITYALVAIFNGLIIYEIAKQSRQMKFHVASKSVRRTSNHQPNTEGSTNAVKSSGRLSSQVHVTITLLSVSCIFMLLWFPWLLVYLNEKLPSNVQGLPSNDTLHACAEIMGPLNSAINFFLYNVTSRRFRREFLHLLAHCRSHDSSSTNSSHNNFSREFETRKHSTTETNGGQFLTSTHFNSNDN
ncbi:hypothetical protein CAPTEDRAFT_191250 [Capitella teleta]|uniref:G-protein coupled receptors family 1 profile domain-containing protein n=1 Tax=Capitella teleta TaxID=283909 RepID=R7TLF1_CAPTE|nr:hypothetical protein CAPTEDRAFT_191250 [Capitella teleta]|eukprot:ELT92371.1 hypothetical protein CAPTEDRAFT_191250 [Capitella teleta]